MDIGSSSVKILELSKNGKAPMNLALETFGSEAVSDGEIRDKALVQNTILTIFNKLKIKTKKRIGSVALGGRGVIIKRMIVMPESGVDILDQAAIDAQQVIPSEDDDLYLRFAPLAKAKKDGSVPMVAVGARRDVVESYVSLIKAVGLKVGIIDCTALSLANMFTYNFKVDDCFSIIVNIGASSSEMVILYEGEFLYTRAINFGGYEYNEAIMQDLSVDYENAENLKLSAATDGQVAESIKGALQRVNEQLCQEVNTTLSHFFDAEDNLPTSSKDCRIFLTGGGAKTLGLEAAIAAGLEMPVEILNPFRKIKAGASSPLHQMVQSQGPLFSAAVGLASRSIG